MQAKNTKQKKKPGPRATAIWTGAAGIGDCRAAAQRTGHPKKIGIVFFKIISKNKKQQKKCYTKNYLCKSKISKSPVKMAIKNANANNFWSTVKITPK